MTEQQRTVAFENRFAGRVRAYTDPATERRIDPLATARAAMSRRRTTAWSPRWLGAGLLGRRIASAGWAGALVAVVLIALLGVAALGRLSDAPIGPQSTPGPSGGGQIPDVLRHTWARPYAVAPGGDQWGSGFLNLANGLLEFGPDQDASASASVSAMGPDALLVTATVDTTGCANGDVGTYRWSLKGKGTVLTLTAIDMDACAARESALVGEWVRSDFPPRNEAGETLAPGRHLTQNFDPFGKPGVSGQLSYTVPEGWKIKEDSASTFVMDHLPSGSAPPHSPVPFIALFAEPRMAADFTEGATCGSITDASGVGRAVDDIVAAIRARPGVVSTPPAAVTIGGYNGQLLDLSLAPSWTRACQTPDGPFITIPILRQAGTEPAPAVVVDPGHPVRLILLDLTEGRTLAVVVFNLEPSQPKAFEELLTDVMPIVESFQFHASTP
jgi:hypothetical protein